MPRLQKTWLLVTTFVAASQALPQSQPQAMTAGELREICIASDSASKKACTFYILGVTQGVSLGMSIADGKTNGGGRPCVPDNVSGSALEYLVKMKLGEDLTVFPDDRKLDASGFVGAVLLDKFPCRRH